MTIRGARVLIKEAYKTKDESDRKALLSLADEILARIESKYSVEPKKEFPIQIYRNYRGKKYKAELLNGWQIAINGDIFNTPSAAAMSISGHNENGWRTWKYFDERTNTEEPIDKLRKMSVRQNIQS